MRRFAGLWSPSSRRSKRARAEVLVAIEQGPGAAGSEWHVDELRSHLQELVGQIEELHAATHGAISRARLAPCVGWPTRCRVLDHDDHTRHDDAVRVVVVAEARPTGPVLAIELTRPGADTVERLDPVDLEGRSPDDVTVRGEMAAKIWSAVVDDLPVRDWRSAARFGRGLLAWASMIAEDRKISSVEFDEIRADLLASLDDDPRNPVVHYNLGALLYERYSESMTRDAIGHFTISFSASYSRDDLPTRFVAGLALTGLSLSYSQLYHRFGRVDDEVLMNCRITARRAVEMLSEVADEERSAGTGAALLRARHAEAFSFHVTEDPSDVEAAITIYEDLVAAWKDFDGTVPATILNNLGYQHMALEGKDEPGCDVDAYERAKALFQSALEVEHDYEMAWANLGNVQRLQKRYDEAEASYRNAIAAAESQGRPYPPAHSELARLHLERGDLAAGKVAYERALELCESDAVAGRVHGEWADALCSVNLDDEARVAARLGVSTWPDEPRSTRVLARLDDGVVATS